MSGDEITSSTLTILTPDGSRTAFNAKYQQAYGSRHGAAGQARHVFLSGSRTDTHPKPKVLEIGFGLGLNFRVTLENTLSRGVRLEYLAYEFDPAPVEVLRAVSSGHSTENHPLWLGLLDSWESRQVQLNQSATSLRVVFKDVLQDDLPKEWASAIYLDGFSPSVNPEVWSSSFIERLAGALEIGGIITTYSAAGHVRRAFEAAGLRVERREGAIGKRECLRAIKEN